MKPVTVKKQFKVALVSSNTNSFGLKNHILIARDGTAYSACKTAQFAHQKGDIVEIECTTPGNFFNFSKAGFELPQNMELTNGKPSQALINEIWGE
jgi:hypothetical protein